MSILAKYEKPIQEIVKTLTGITAHQSVMNDFFTKAFKTSSKTGVTSLASNLVKYISEEQSDTERKKLRSVLSAEGSRWLKAMKRRFPNVKKWDGVKFCQKSTGGEFYLALIDAGEGGGSKETDDSESFFDCDTITSIEKLIKRDGYELVSQAMIIIIESHEKAERNRSDG